jgi:hypothetical protein
MSQSGDGKTVATTGPNPFEVYANAVSPRTIVGKLLKFTKGDFIAGEGSEVVPETAEFTAIMDEALAGWVKWEDGKPTEHRMGRIADNYIPPRREELGDIDRAAWETFADGKARDPWQFANYLVLKRESEDELFTFVAGSRGSLGAVGDLCRQYARHAKKHPEQYPVIRLMSSGTYEHRVKSYGRIAYPILCVVGWTPKTDLDLATAAPPPDDLFDDYTP